MKLLTLNAHSLMEEDYEEKLRYLIDFMIREQPDVAAFQEASQSITAKEAGEALNRGRVSLPGERVPLRADNYAARVALGLRAAGLECAWTWLPVKLGYHRLDEGVALLSLSGRICETASHVLSARDDYHSWKTRKALGVRIEGWDDWFYTVHMGWWGDREEPFVGQWNALQKAVAEQKEKGPVWLMGDFNNPAEIRGEGYDLMCESGWRDAWTMADQTDGCATVRGHIDGWREERPECGSLRMDQIWCSREITVKKMRVVLDGRREKQVSDHFGLLLER